MRKIKAKDSHVLLSSISSFKSKSWHVDAKRIDAFLVETLAHCVKTNKQTTFDTKTKDLETLVAHKKQKGNIFLYCIQEREKSEIYWI